MLDRHWGFPAGVETTLEADPLTFTPERLRRFAALGFSRLSIGLQSTQDAVLRFLGRRHDGRQGLEALAWALASGLAVNADVITAVPGQDAEADLRAVAGTGVAHSVTRSVALATKESLKLFMFQAPRKAKRLYFDVIPRTVDDYLGLLAVGAHFAWQVRTTALSCPACPAWRREPLARKERTQ